MENFLNSYINNKLMFGSAGRMKGSEKLLMLVGFILTIAVFYLVNFYFTGQGLIIWALVETAVMWIIIISLLVMADNHRVLNNELKAIIREHIEESKTLKEISNEQLQEIKLLKKFANDALKKMKRK